MIRLLNSLANAVGETWCQVMHPDPMWPVRGEYQCRVCQRRYPVAWEQHISEEDRSTKSAKPLAATPEPIARATAQTY